MTAKFPHMRSAKVAITLEDGRTFQHFQAHRKGDPEAPLSDAELNDKFQELTSPVNGEGPARHLLQQLWNIDRLKVADLRLTTLANGQQLQWQQTVG